MIYFHQNLEALRKSKRLSQQMMADRYNLSQTSYGRWEKESTPDLETILDLARFFEVTVDDLLAREMKKEGIRQTKKEVAGLSLMAETQLNRLIVNKDIKLFESEEKLKIAFDAIMQLARQLENLLPEKEGRAMRDELDRELEKIKA